MQELTHYMNGAHVKGTSGRFADVYNPATGEVQAQCPLANESELDQAVQYAMAAQPAWAAVNPQRRARVMMKFVDLLNRDMDKLAEALSREHGKTLPDAAGDVQRGLEVVEYCIGAPELLKGDYTDSAGPGIDMYSMRQPLGVSAGITPFNFPAMIPMWMFAPAIVCGNAFILKPSERDPSVPLMLAELLEEAGLPKGIIQVVNGDKEAVDAILHHPVIQSVGFVGSTPIAEYIYGTGCANGKRVQCFGGAKNHMIIMPDADLDQAADALIGAGYGAAGEPRAMMSITALWSPQPQRPTSNAWCRPVLIRVPRWLSTGATLSCKGMKTASLSARTSLTTSPPTWTSTSTKSSGRFYPPYVQRPTKRRLASRWITKWATAPRSLPVTATRPVILPPA